MNMFWMVALGFAALGRGRSIIVWAFAGYLFGWLAAIPFLFLKSKSNKVGNTLDKINEHLDNILIKQETKKAGNYETVDDLFKQLDKK